ASTARRDGARPISPRLWPSPTTGCRPTASPLPATISPRASTRSRSAGAWKAAIASPPSMAGSRPMRRSRRRAFTRRATARPTSTPAAFRGFYFRNAAPTRSELGGRFDRLLLLHPQAALTLRARVAWAHDWVSDPTLVPMFQALPGASFIVNGATLAKNSTLTSAGAELRLANGVALLAKFDGEFASHSSTYAGTGTVRYAW